MASLIKVTMNPKHRLMIALGYGCGLRVAEAVNVRVQDFYSDFSMLHSWEGTEG